MTIRSLLSVSAPLLALGPLDGCDPVVNIAGANFPAWLLCALLGGLLAAAFKPIFATLGVEPYMGPAVLIYPCLAILLACIIYLALFNRV